MMSRPEPWIGKRIQALFESHIIRSEGDTKLWRAGIYFAAWSVLKVVGYSCIKNIWYTNCLQQKTSKSPRMDHRLQRLCSISKEQQVQNMLKLLRTTKRTTGLWSVWICRFRWKNTLDRIAKLLQFCWVPFPGQLKNPQYAAASFLLLGQEVLSLVHSFFCSWVQHSIWRILHAHSSVPWSLQFFHLHRVQRLWMQLHRIPTVLISCIQKKLIRHCCCGSRVTELLKWWWQQSFLWVAAVCGGLEQMTIRDPHHCCVFLWLLLLKTWVLVLQSHAANHKPKSKILC